MAGTTTSAGHELAKFYREGGAYSQVYIDMSVDTSDPPGVKEERRKSVLDSLARQGAPEADIDAITDALATGPTAPSPVCLYVLARDGELLLEEALPGIAVAPESVTFGPLPDLSPLLRMQPLDFAYLVVETARDGGEVRLYRAGSSRPESEEHVQGRTDTLHKVRRGGDWRNDHFQNHTEEIWKQTQSQLASTVDEIVRQHGPRLIVVAGDIRARQLLEEQLSEASRAIVAVEPTNTRADGASDDALAQRIDAEIERVLAGDKRAVLDRIALHEGRGDNLVELSFGAIVHALASAQVETLVLDSDRLADREALALDAEPWIATAPEDALGAGVIATVPAQLALTRAALLTDATILFTDSFSATGTGDRSDADDAVALPHDAAVAAILRWRTGPPVPGA
jgi:hypothetical protein